MQWNGTGFGIRPQWADDNKMVVVVFYLWCDLQYIMNRLGGLGHVLSELMLEFCVFYSE